MNAGRIEFSIFISIIAAFSSMSSFAATTTEVPYISSPDRGDEILVVSLDHEQSPARGATAGWITEASIFTDDNAIVFEIFAKDTQPSAISSSPTRRDGILPHSDYVVLSVDPDSAGLRAFSFAVNPSGAVADAIVSSSQQASPGWNGVWSSEAQIVADGYKVKVRIPFDTLGLSGPGSGGRMVGINIGRRIGRGRFEYLTSSPIDERAPCRECQYQRYTLSNKNERKWKLRVNPYVVSSAEWRASESDSLLDAGLDITLANGGGKKLSATANPDFSAIDIDLIQFDINKKFASSYSEKRPFFLDSAGSYSTALPLIYTRSVADISYAAQYVSEQDGRSQAGLFSRDRETVIIVPGPDGSHQVVRGGPSNNFATRLHMKYSDDFSGGLLATYREASKYDNYILALDGSYRSSEQTSLDGQIAYSETNERNEADRRSTNGFAGSATHEYLKGPYSSYTGLDFFSADFRADLGFVNQSDVVALAHGSEWSFPSESRSNFIQKTTAGVTYSNTSRLSGLATLLQNSSAFLSLRFKNNSLVSLSLERGAERWQGRNFALGRIEASYIFSLGEDINVAAGYELGDAIDYGSALKGIDRNISMDVIFRSLGPASGHLGLNIYKFSAPNGLKFSTNSLNWRVQFDFNLINHLTFLLTYGQSIVQDHLSDVEFSSLSYQFGYQLDLGSHRSLQLGYAGTALASGYDRLSIDSERFFFKGVWSF